MGFKSGRRGVPESNEAACATVANAKTKHSSLFFNLDPFRDSKMLSGGV